MITPEGQTEVEAAHIVPRHMAGADDARNGLALCRRHHWAFDRGLFGVSASTRKVVVPAKVQLVASNAELRSLIGRAIDEANDARLIAHPEALAWHVNNVLQRYS